MHKKRNGVAMFVAAEAPVIINSLLRLGSVGNTIEAVGISGKKCYMVKLRKNGRCFGACGK